VSQAGELLKRRRKEGANEREHAAAPVKCAVNVLDPAGGGWEYLAVSFEWGPDFKGPQTLDQGGSV
jgi:hypothetical protein